MTIIAPFPNRPIDESQLPIKVEYITVTTNGSGAASAVSAYINGEILKIHYNKGTVNAGTTVALTETTTTDALDSYDVNSGTATRYPVVALTGAAAGDNKWTRHVVADTITATVAGGATSKTCTVYIYYR